MQSAEGEYKRVLLLPETSCRANETKRAETSCLCGISVPAKQVPLWQPQDQFRAARAGHHGRPHKSGPADEKAPHQKHCKKEVPGAEHESKAIVGIMPWPKASLKCSNQRWFITAGSPPGRRPA